MVMGLCKFKCRLLQVIGDRDGGVFNPLNQDHHHGKDHHLGHLQPGASLEEYREGQEGGCCVFSLIIESGNQV